MNQPQPQAPMVSVVIPTYNEESRIRNCLHSIFAQRTEHSFEVIVVDSSRDGTADLVRREFPEAQIIQRTQQTFAAEARNIGIENARGSLVAFIDADCVAEPDWLNAIVSAHRSHFLAIGGPIALNTPATLAGTALFGIEFAEYGQSSPAREIRWLPSCNLSVKRAALEQYGGFPTHMQASEDMLFCRELMEKSGAPLWFDPAIRIRHSNRNDFAGLRSKMKTLGYWSGRLRAFNVVPGGFLLRYPFTIPLLLPYRLGMVIARLLFRSRDPRLIAMAILGWPLLGYGLWCWTYAFYKGTRSASQPSVTSGSDGSD